MEIKDRIRMLMTEKNLKGTDLTRMIGISSGGISQWVNGQVEPSGKNLLKLAAALECDAGWLQTGESTPVNNALTYEMIPVLNVELAAGDGSHIDMESVVDHVPISSEWIFKNNHYVKDLKVVTVKGDSMAPRLQDGDQVLIDVSDIRPVNSNVYAIALDGELKIKRILRPDPYNTIIMSDNEEYSPIPIANNEINNLRIIGRAVKVLMGDI